jgi:hypothetical protein
MCYGRRCGECVSGFDCGGVWSVACRSALVFPKPDRGAMVTLVSVSTR